MSAFLHESLHRSQASLVWMRDTTVTLCGAGALGGNIAEGLARAGFGQLKIIDQDRVAEHNLSTQPYQRADIGASKAKTLAHSLYRAVGTGVETRFQTLEASNVNRLLKNSQLVVDSFDNHASRQLVKNWCGDNQIPCLHAGMGNAYGEVIWNSDYRVPADVPGELCDYPLARNLVVLTAAIACEIIIDFVLTDQQRSYTITLGDLSIRPFISG